MKLVGFVSTNFKKKWHCSGAGGASQQHVASLQEAKDSCPE